MNDSKIAIDIINKLRLDSELNSPNIVVLVKDGIVTLKGNVLSKKEKHLAEQTALATRGVMSILNEINVELNPLYQPFDVEIVENVTSDPACDAVTDFFAWDVITENIIIVEESLTVKDNAGMQESPAIKKSLTMEKEPLIAEAEYFIRRREPEEYDQKKRDARFVKVLSEIFNRWRTL
ncbi:MAG: BON domain-containing protein [Candidatus Paracaedibacteraceae bacterium]|nr:BON domain-containing protein [Candidatus Paracaedibacteraceae bacterium]